MSLGARIEERLQALGLTQAELARRAGVPQTTLNSLVRGKARTSPHLIRIARELRTTPAFLMEETDDLDAEFPALSLSSEELEWVELLRSMTPADRKSILHIARWKLAPDGDGTGARGFRRAAPGEIPTTALEQKLKKHGARLAKPSKP